MKKLCVIGLFALASLNSPLSWASDFKPSSNIVTLMPIVMDNLDTLELTTDELDQIRAVSRKSFSMVEQINAEYHEIKSELKEELLDIHNQDNVHSQKLVEELVALDKKRMELTLECTLALKQILPQNKFEEVISLLDFQS